MVVWQDMPSMFGEGDGWQPRGFFQGEERTVSKKFEELASEKNLKLDAISNPKTSGDDENISRVTITLKKGDSTEKYRMVFYGDIVIYIADDSGDSIIDLND